MARKDLPENNSGTNKLGLFMALAFYLVSVVMVAINTAGAGGFFDRDVQTITIAHWQLEDGFRQSFDFAIKQYEELKAREGKKVRIIQTTVPIRGYAQWFVTQLISGDPADIIELHGSSQLQNQYFVPLSSYISMPNPYNKGTVLEGIPWKDTYIDGMNSALDTIYTEYFGVGTFFHVNRVYVNKQLLREAKGNDKMPETFDEWMEDCRKLREYGRKSGRPIIPIGVRGFDKGTLASLFSMYFSQLNGDLNDTAPRFCGAGASVHDIFPLMASGGIDRDRLLAAVDLTKEIGRNFGEGFTATDLEQTKFLFFTGNVGFFPEGTWNAWSMVNNTPFEVEVINIPPIGKDSRYYKYFTGMPSEIGVGVGGKFGITKASRHFDLALDFLHYLTSYNINQQTMMEFCKWPPAVIKAEYKGLLKKFEPVKGDARRSVALPFSMDRKSRTKMLESLERIIVSDIPRPQQYFWDAFIGNIGFAIEEAREGMDSSDRQLFDIAGQRSCAGVGLLESHIPDQRRRTMEYRYAMTLENLVDRLSQRYFLNSGLEALETLKKNGGKPVPATDKEN